MKKLSFYIVPVLAYWFIRSLKFTMSLRYVHHERYTDLQDSGKKVILACWHGRLLMIPYGQRAKKFTGLISMHSDGELLARTLKKFNMDAVRGSTSRGSLEGIKGLLRAVKSGSDVLGITPDGPRGPARECQMGVVYIAKMTGLPVVAVGIGAFKRKTFKSWDSFTLPYPFSSCVFTYSEPVYVARKAGDDEMEEKRQLIEERLNEVTDEADRLAGGGG